MTVTSADNSGVPVGTKVSEITYTNGVLTSIKLDKELTAATTGSFTFTAAASVGNAIQGAHGSLLLNADGSYTYTPARVKVVVAHVMQPTAVYRDSH